MLMLVDKLFISIILSSVLTPVLPPSIASPFFVMQYTPFL
jgi:hypothetical protein